MSIFWLYKASLFDIMKVSNQPTNMSEIPLTSEEITSYHPEPANRPSNKPELVTAEEMRELAARQIVDGLSDRPHLDDMKSAIREVEEDGTERNKILLLVIRESRRRTKARLVATEISHTGVVAEVNGLLGEPSIVDNDKEVA